jgi:hypothetical protein
MAREKKSTIEQNVGMLKRESTNQKIAKEEGIQNINLAFSFSSFSATLLSFAKSNLICPFYNIFAFLFHIRMAS